MGIPQQLSLKENHQNSPDFYGGRGFDSPDDNNDDQQKTGILDPPNNHPEVLDSQTKHSAAREIFISIDLAGISAPFTITMDGHVILLRYVYSVNLAVFSNYLSNRL